MSGYIYQLRAIPAKLSLRDLFRGIDFREVIKMACSMVLGILIGMGWRATEKAHWYTNPDTQYHVSTEAPTFNHH